ncbi:multicopper oxidase family protein [Paenibacillus senegalensis]|uniref:multicopper oxidase family protein n=1 Tax=Paenibacillus senegalensis TaxID=1465766 RepID=UPI000289C6CC|nr:multicopper oxidase family protein [Paenibacillus senegalensis]
MLEALYGIEFLLLMAFAGVWGINSLCAANYAYAVFRKEKENLWRIIVRYGLITGISIFFLWLVNVLLIMLLLGPWFALDRLVVMLPVAAFPALFVMIMSQPKWKYNGPVDPDTLVTMVVPIHSMFIGSLLVFHLLTMNIPAVPDTTEAIAYLAILTGSAAILWWLHKNRFHRLRYRTPGRVVQVVRASSLVTASCLLLSGGYAWSIYSSKLPDTMAMVSHHMVDFGGGVEFAVDGMHQHGHSHGQQAAPSEAAISVTELTGPQTGEADKRFTLVAEKKTIELSSGKTIEAWTYNGQVPGPELVVNQGDLVEVTIVNRDIEQGVTLHWHGIDVPNAEDGVAGMTQDAVLPGESFTYRFVVEEVGSHWYHSHQVSSIQVQKGLFGSFVILPEHQEPAPNSLDITTMAHDWIEGHETVATTLDNFDTVRHETVAPGTEMRIRLVNSSSLTKIFGLHGTAYTIAAIDGYDLNEPGQLSDVLLEIGGGGRYDVTFTMPDTPVTLQLHGSDAAIVYSSDGKGEPSLYDSRRTRMPVLDPTRYGSPDPEASPFSADTEFDREFTVLLDMIYLGSHNGQGNALWAINGKTFPNTPTFMVREGDLVKSTIYNRTFAHHPMHLHGHHIHVVSKNGKPLEGSPLVLDTLLVKPGEVYEVAFEANNPGMWMDHCHDLNHAALGMSMHLSYENVTTPYRMGGPAGNHPE